METLSNKINLHLGDDAEVLIKGFIAPIEDMNPNFHEEWYALANLRVAEPEKMYSTSVFRSFLPDKPVSVADYWQIDEQGALALLKQFQRNPNLDMHINAGDSQGLWACLHAYNDELANIMFRIHTAFALEDGWFTPSQLAGNLVIDRINKSVAFFQMCVPEGTLFDVNWKKQKDEPNYYYSAGGGVCPKFELVTEKHDVSQETVFTTSITREEAEYILIQRFYKSMQINWVPFEEALEISQTQQKPIHAISVDGPLSDEAC
ncbi:hypothetical protein JT359_00970 [Candidatus Poribacteria bacterium]|nr:hypothetical protein [Candidatus Poribacteria bacterium]